MRAFKLSVLGFLACLVAGVPAVAGEGKAPTPILASDAQKLKVRAGAGAGNVQRVSLGVNKGLVVELPEDARDVLVSNPQVVDAIVRTPRQIYLVGLKMGSTNAFFFTATGRQILNLELSVERDIGDLKSVIERTIEGSRIEVESVNDSVVLKGTVRTASDADAARQIALRHLAEAGKTPTPDSVVSRLGIRGGEQVMLSVRVAEMQRNISKQLGVDVGAAFSLGGEVPVLLSSVNPFSLLGRALSPTQGFVIGSTATNDVGATIRALERTGMIRTLAEPNLTAISGEAAKFLAGGEFPVPVGVDDQGRVQIEFKPYGVGLGFTPIVLSDGRISLRISTEVSEITSENAFVNGGSGSAGGITVPGLRVRRAETTVELPSGGSMVMAGLLQQALKQNIDGVPGLKDIPVIGSLFQSRDFQSGETELVVIVTPYLVKAVANDRLATPLDGFVPPTDAETVLLSRLNAVYGDGQKVKGNLKGPAGFTID
jgi:pilus assembly protein CpaC